MEHPRRTADAIGLASIGLEAATVRAALQIAEGPIDATPPWLATLAIDHVDPDRHSTRHPARLEADAEALPTLHTLLASDATAIRIGGGRSALHLSLDRTRRSAIAEELLAHDTLWHEWADPHDQDRPPAGAARAEHADTPREKRRRALRLAMVGTGPDADDEDTIPIRDTVASAIASALRERACTAGATVR